LILNSDSDGYDSIFEVERAVMLTDGYDSIFEVERAAMLTVPTIINVYNFQVSVS
jgi:hypothetical protein